MKGECSLEHPLETLSLHCNSKCHHSMKRHAYRKTTCKKISRLIKKCLNTVFRFAKGKQNTGFGSKESAWGRVRWMRLYFTPTHRIKQHESVRHTMTLFITTFSLMGMAQMDSGTHRHSNGHRGLTPTFLLGATYGKRWGHKEPDPSPSQVNSETQLIFSPVCCLRNELFTKKKQVNIFHSLLFLDIEQEKLVNCFQRLRDNKGTNNYQQALHSLLHTKTVMRLKGSWQAIGKQSF